MNIKQFYAHLLGLKDPWYVDSIEIDEKDNRVDVYVKHHNPIRVACPVCKEFFGMYDHAPDSTANTIFNISGAPGGIDGEISAYNNNGTGYSYGIIEGLNNLDGTTSRLFIMDFSNEANATAAYNGIINSPNYMSNPTLLPNYPAHQAIITLSSGASRAYYHKGRFFFRLELSSLAQ